MTGAEQRLGLFAIRDKQSGGLRVGLWWKETHIPAGRRTSEPGHVEVNAPRLETTQAFEPGRPPRPASTRLLRDLPGPILLFPLRGKPKPPLPPSSGEGQRSERQLP